MVHEADGAERLVVMQPLADLVHERDPLRVVLANVDAVARAALERRSSYRRKDGSVIETTAPDFATALRAMEVGAKVLAAPNRVLMMPLELTMPEEVERLRRIVSAYDAKEPEQARTGSTAFAPTEYESVAQAANPRETVPDPRKVGHVSGPRPPYSRFASCSSILDSR
jgi:hypothetical protein